MSGKAGAKVEPDALLRIEYVPLDKIARFDKNPKKHDVGALVTSIRRYGFRDAPIFDGTLKALVAGHGRLKALEAMKCEGDKPPAGIIEHSAGQWLVPVQMGVDSKSAAEAKAFLIDHNTLTLSGGDLGVDSMLRLYDQAGLEELLKESGPTVSFDGEDIDELINGKKEVVEDDPSGLIDAAKELEKKWGTKLGQLWILGEHRVLCGDSTKADDVGRVMGGGTASLMVTDPPYGVDYEGVTNDDFAGLVALLGGAMTCADRVLVPGGAYYICHPDIHVYEFTGVIRSIGWKQARPSVVQWVKDRAVMGRGDYHSQSEPMLYGWKHGAAHHAVADRKQSNVWNFPRPQKADGHPTMKPVGLFARAVENSSNKGEMVYDPFLGSGTTLIAADQLKRKCYGLEISPQYVAVILERWSKATGGEPKLEG